VSAARQALLDKTLTYVARHGMSDLSLRELAAAVGTSHRMLIYHFGSRDGLVASIVESMEDRQREALAALAGTAMSPRRLITAQWEQLADPELRPFVVLFFEVLALALHNRPGTEGFLVRLTTPWLDLTGRIADDLNAPQRREELLLGVAVVRGLLLEAVVSGDYGSSTAALHRFLDMWDASTRTQGRQQRKKILDA
jgi:AcrR family transcriptional regulator